MFVPIAVGLLTLGAYTAKSKRDAARRQPSAQVMAERAVIYDTALNYCKDPDKLREMAAVFRQEGHVAEADMLIKRALLRELPPEVAQARKAAYAKGMASKNPEAVRALAAAFEEQGATGAAMSLREYALGVEAMQAGLAESKPTEPTSADKPSEEPAVQEEAVH